MPKRAQIYLIAWSASVLVIAGTAALGGTRGDLTIMVAGFVLAFPLLGGLGGTYVVVLARRFRDRVADSRPGLLQERGVGSLIWNWHVARLVELASDPSIQSDESLRLHARRLSVWYWTCQAVLVSALVLACGIVALGTA